MFSFYLWNVRHPSFYHTYFCKCIHIDGARKVLLHDGLQSMTNHMIIDRPKKKRHVTITKKKRLFGLVCVFKFLRLFIFFLRWTKKEEEEEEISIWSYKIVKRAPTRHPPPVRLCWRFFLFLLFSSSSIFHGTQWSPPIRPSPSAWNRYKNTPTFRLLLLLLSSKRARVFLLKEKNK